MSYVYVEWVAGRVSMSLEKFFSVEARVFCLCSGGCWWFCMVFVGLLARVLMVLSMLLSVTFNVGMRGI